MADKSPPLDQQVRDLQARMEVVERKLKDFEVGGTNSAISTAMVNAALLVVIMVFVAVSLISMHRRRARYDANKGRAYAVAAGEAAELNHRVKPK